VYSIGVGTHCREAHAPVFFLWQPAPHPRGYPVNRDELEELCVDDSERSRLAKVPPSSGHQCVRS